MYGCDDIFDKTDEYLDGELSAEECALFEKHIKSCGECRKNVEFAKNLNSVMGGMPSVEPPEDFLEQLHKRINRDSNVVRFYRKWQSYGVLAACVILAVVIRSNVVNDVEKTTDYLIRTTPAPTQYGYTQNTRQAAPSGENADIVPEQTAVPNTDEVKETPDADKNEAVSEEMFIPKTAPAKETAEPRVATNTDTAQEIPKDNRPQSESMPEYGDNEQSVETAEAADESVSVSDSDGVNAVSIPSEDVSGGSDVPVLYSSEAEPSTASLTAGAETFDGGTVSRKTSGGTGAGAGGGSSAPLSGSSAAAVTSAMIERKVNTIDIGYKETVTGIITELGIASDGNEYIASAEAYNKLVEMLKENGISFDGICTYEGDNVRFVIEWE